jgi:hypothetical protein
MRKYLFFLLTQTLLIASCNTDNNKEKNEEETVRNFTQFGYVYHFYKKELEESYMEPSNYKPKAFMISGKVQAKLYPGDTLIRFVYRGSTEKWKNDSTVELLKPVKLSDKENSMIPTEVLGCHLIGVYNSMNEDARNEFYQCFYVNENDDLLRVAHLYKPGNVSAAFFYTKENIDPTDRYKGDIGKLLAVDRPSNLLDTIDITH